MTELLIRESGRPTDCSSRLAKETRCYDLLDSLGVEYDRVDHAPAETMEACSEIDGVLGCRMCKNLFLSNRQKTDFYLLLLRGEKPFKTKYVSRELGVSRLSFADGDDMEKYLDITPGSVSVLGLMNDRENRVRLLIDRNLLTDEYIGVHPCVNTSSLRIKMSDLTEKIIPSTAHAITPVDIRADEEL